MVHTNADGRTLFVEISWKCSKLRESTLDAASEQWLAQNRLRRAGSGTHILDPIISFQQRERKEFLHHSALQCEGDNILQCRPDRGKKVFAHPTLMVIGGDISKLPPKCIWAQNASF